MPDLNSPTRLGTFRGPLLQTGSVAELDALCAKVVQLTEAPIALVSLVMERVQFFRASVGLPEDLAVALGASRCESFCQFVVAEGQPFIVTDAVRDGRVPRALVDRYGIAAYIGAPITVHGTVVGSLCAVDVKPRHFTEACIARMQDYAQSTSQLLERLLEEDSPTRSSSQKFDGDDTEDTPEVLRRMRLQLGVLENLLEICAPDTGALQRKLSAATSVVGRLTPTPEDISRRVVPELEALDKTRRQLSEMSALIEELRAASGFLRRLPNRTPQQEKLITAMNRLDRALAEGSVLFRVVGAWAEHRMDAPSAARAVSVVHEALGSVSDALDATRVAHRTVAECTPSAADA